MQRIVFGRSRREFSNAYLLAKWFRPAQQSGFNSAARSKFQMGSAGAFLISYRAVSFLRERERPDIVVDCSPVQPALQPADRPDGSSFRNFSCSAFFFLACVSCAILKRVHGRPPGSTASSAMLGLTQLANYLTLKGSFSAVSKPTFGAKYVLESSRRDLQMHSFAPFWNRSLSSVVCSKIARMFAIFR